MENSELNKALKKYQQWGLSVIPIAHRDKQPLVEWKEYQNRQANARELEEWFGNMQAKNIGVVCGRVSGNLVVLDFDSHDGKWEDFRIKYMECYNKSIDDATTIVKTDRGYHVYLRTSDTTPTYKLENLDIKGEGSYVVAPPSIHPAGSEYQFVNLNVSEILQLNSIEELGITLPVHKETPMESVEITEIAELIAPCWTEGNRHELSLYLTAYLAKIGWAFPMIRKEVKLVSGEDEEPKDRLKAMEGTFKRIRSNQPVKGYRGLEEILPKAVLDRIEILAKAAHVPPAVRRIDDIRQSNEKACFRNRHIAELVEAELLEEGKLLRTIGDEFFYYCDSVIALDSPDFKALLDTGFGLNATEGECKFVLSHLETVARTKGEDVQVYRLAYWDRVIGVLYIDCGNGLVLALDGKHVSEVKNGSNGIYFIRERWQQPVKPDLENPLNPWEHLTDDLSFEIGEMVALTPEQQMTVARIWILSLFFPEELPTKPILCLTGDAGSGKSFFLRRLVKFLYGNGDLDTLRDKDDLWASLSANHLLALDDVEEDKTPKWASQELKRASTGQTITLRKLYTTNTQISFTPRCFVAFTSINPPIEDSALAERLIILRLKKLENAVPESALIRTTLEQRDKLMGGLIKELNALIHNVLEMPHDSTFRMADWASFAERVLNKRVVDSLTRGLTHFQDEMLLVDSPIPAILEVWTEGRGKWLTANDLLKLWHPIIETRDIYFPFTKPNGLGKHLGSIKHNLARIYGVKFERSGHGKLAVYNFPVNGE